jgi:Condensation domain
VTVREVPATVGQRLLWMMDHYRGNADYGAFNCPVLCRIRGRLDPQALTVSLDALVGRHDSLRTVFAGRGHNLRQLIRPAQPVPFAWRDVSTAPFPLTAAEDEIATELRTGMDVTESTVRASIWRLADTDHILCLNLHHMITDAWSTGVIFRELQSLYARRGDPAGLPPVRWQYPDFARWQQEQIDSGELRRQYDYWLRQLDGAHLAQPPRLAGATAAATAPTGVASVDLDEPTTQTLRDLAREQRTTLFAVLLAGYFAQLHRATGQPDITVASLFANRSRPETQGTVGFLANMVMLRARRADVGDLRELIRATHATAVGAFAHQQQPFQMLPAHLLDTGGMRADDVVFQLVTDPQHRGHAGGAEFELLVPDAIGSRFSFELVVAPLGAGLRAVLFYRRDWFADDWAARFAAGYGELLTGLRGAVPA